ncbi:WD repeat-containing protein 46 [Dictyocoela muelleri]|nr:WD repeat-containing protein 46 [Dictyocoela muelleri]
MTLKKTEKALKKTFELAQEAHKDILSASILQSEPKFLSKELTQRILRKKSLNANLAYDLDLDGPVRSRYSRNGKNILVFNNNMVTSYETKTLNLKFEIKIGNDNFRRNNFNNTDSGDFVNDAIFLHNELYVAVAQRRNVFIYNHDGVELHSIREQCNRMEFLNYHFLLVRVGNDPYLKYQDTSTGKIVSTIFIGEKFNEVMTQNKNNAIIFIGNRNGTVTLWAPNCKEKLAKVLCHSSKILSVKIQNDLMVTLGLDKKLNIWDCRNLFKPLGTIKMKHNAENMDLSQTNLIALSYKNHVNVLRMPVIGSDNNYVPDIIHNNDDLVESQKFIANDIDCRYLGHTFHPTMVSNLQFWPYEDILTVGYSDGLSNLIVPGAGNPNFDFYEESPFETKKERQEKEVISLLEKIPPEMISMNLPYDVEKDIYDLPQLNRKKPENDQSEKRNALSRFMTKKNANKRN